MILRYPPGLSLNLGPRSEKSFPTAESFLSFEKALLLLATESTLANVTNGSKTPLSSFAFGTVVFIDSVSIKEITMFLNIAFL